MAKFKTSARSVDMLGRQQIAGIPTAISEIFKNAYDAYATGVRGDYLPDARVLVIRDDGIGMSEEDFATRWLTIGTDSKAAGTTLPAVRRPEGIAQRKQMGEKGIGRLAIASTGPQLLLVTRALADGAVPARLVVALIQWSVFEIPGLTLDDVVIPVRTVDDVDEIDATVLASMSQEVSDGLSRIRNVDPAMRERIVGELGSLDFDPRLYLRLNGPGPAGGHGTAFIIRPVSDDLDAALEIRDQKVDEHSVSEFQRFLLGFVNSITAPPADLTFTTEFIRHDSKGIADLIDPASYFWDTGDFGLTDHTIEGSFDATGTFEGTLSVYGADPIPIVETWPPSQGRLTACGPFSIKFGYVQGTPDESRLSPPDFADMTSRLEKIGGLYVYRDGIRVLPYGNADTDYLEIEKRRTLNAGRYYFSYRRMYCVSA